MSLNYTERATVQTFYVLHSPYPNGTWRGWEKCYGTEFGVVMCATIEEAQAMAMGVDVGFKVWPVTIEVPDAGSVRPEGGGK